MFHEMAPYEFLTSKNYSMVRVVYINLRDLENADCYIEYLSAKKHKHALACFIIFCGAPRILLPREGFEWKETKLAHVNTLVCNFSQYSCFPLRFKSH